MADSPMFDDDWFEREQLHIAAQDGDSEYVRELIADGRDVNAFDELGMTPLHYAAMNGHIAVVDLLLANGADVNAHHEPSIGNTPLGEVAGNCSLEIAKRLVDAGADPTIPGFMQITALDRAQARKRGDGPPVYALLKKATRGRTA